MILQPSMERRKSGSHYTRKAMTEPIVKAALEPVLANLSEGMPTPEDILGLKICDIAMGSGAFLVESCLQVGDHLVEAWKRTKTTPKIPPDETDQLHARRLIAQKCLYGVDKNPMAVHLAKLSLWLATLAKDHDFTFLDHNLKEGDSLVGLTKENIANFRWNKSLPGMTVSKVDSRIKLCIKDRMEILNDNDSRPNHWKHQLLLSADEALSLPRRAGKLALSAFFEKSKEKERNILRGERYGLWTQYLGLNNDDNIKLEFGLFTVGDIRLLPEIEKILDKFGINSFNWQIEFPEVFEREHPGFDVIVGNPPFAGKNIIAEANPPAYLDWLKEIHEESHGNSDLVAHFFRHAFNLLRNGGTIGLIATNTIGQGDTRSTGLRWICNHGGRIYRAFRRVKWAGIAAVIVSVIHIQKEQTKKEITQNKVLSQAKGRKPKIRNPELNLFKLDQESEPKFPLESKRRTPCNLDGKSVDRITAFLFHAGGNNDPVRLTANEGKSFVGCYVLGMGFTFDDSNPDATSILEMNKLIKNNPKNSDLIFPYIGGEEVNTKPTQSHHRYVINFGEMSESEANNFPDLFSIVEKKVKPERIKLGSNPDAIKRKNFWWQWGRYTPALFESVKKLDFVLVTSRVSSHSLFSFLPSSMIFSDSIIVFPFQTRNIFSVLQSRIHEIWARFLGSSMKDDLRYTPSDCFETFPFPIDWNRNGTLESVGKTYYDFRANLMVRNNQGLTATYNRFHDPEERDPEILQLRNLHGTMDRAVLDAYGWSDIPNQYEFLLDYDDEEESSRKKKPWKYRFPDEIRDEILARLLELNAQRAAEEAKNG